MLLTLLARAPVAAAPQVAGGALPIRAGNGATFATDVAPIIFEQCAACHRPGASAPFSLLTYADVRPRARQILDAVTRGTMPPWAPEPGYGEFEGVRKLSAQQIATLRTWVESGAPSGDLTSMPAAPEFPDGWQLGIPDLVVRLPKPYRLPPGGPDTLRNFVIPITIPARRYVKSWEFQTSNLQVVHHSMVLVDPTRRTREQDEADPEPGYEGLVPLSAQMPDGYFVDWTPGQVPYVAPDDMAWPLEPNSDIILVLHLRPTDKWEAVEASIGLHFSDTPPTHTPSMIRLSRQDIDIPAGEPRYTITDSYVLPVDVEAFDIKPHAHNLAREMKVYADLPDGSRQWLIYITRWDFHWQDSYRYKKPVLLPAGSRVTMEYTYDNSSANRANLNSPPKRVTFGQQTSNEMGDMWLQVLPRRQADLPILNEGMRAKMLPQDIVGYEMMLRFDPDNITLRDDLAGLFTQARDFKNAAAQLEVSLRLRPNAPAAHYALGYARLQLREFDEAEKHFTATLKIDPLSADARYGLGMALWTAGKRDDAVRIFRETVSLMPTSAEAHYNLGVLLQWSNQLDAALSSYKQALQINPRYADAYFAAGFTYSLLREPRLEVESLRHGLALQPDWAPALVMVAWRLATSSDPAIRDARSALVLAERAVDVTGGRDGGALDALAAALAANGEFSRAVSTAERALTILESVTNPAAVGAARARLELYRKREVYTELR